MTVPPTEEEKRGIGERIALIIASVLEKNSLERLMNIKAVDIERYYKIEPLILDHYRKGRGKISEDMFFDILKATEQEKKRVVYTRRTDVLDLDD